QRPGLVLRPPDEPLLDGREIDAKPAADLVEIAGHRIGKALARLPQTGEGRGEKRVAIRPPERLGRIREGGARGRRIVGHEVAEPPPKARRSVRAPLPRLDLETSDEGVDHGPPEVIVAAPEERENDLVRAFEHILVEPGDRGDGAEDAKRPGAAALPLARIKGGVEEALRRERRLDPTDVAPPHLVARRVLRERALNEGQRGERPLAIVAPLDRGRRGELRRDGSIGSGRRSSLGLLPR